MSYYYTGEDIEKLERKAREIRKTIMELFERTRMGHPGGSLSEVEILVVLYYHILRVEAKNPRDGLRDRFVLSKGHGSPTLYAILADRGFFGRQELASFRQFGSLCTSYPDMRTPGIDMVSGSLGNGLSAAVGMALCAKRRKEDWKTYVLLGEGELQEGLVWEAAMAAAYHRLDHLVAIVDSNGLQINGRVNEIMTIDPLPDKWKAFGWAVVEADGHSVKSLLDAFRIAVKMCGPTVIIAHTVKGKGVSFMEDVAYWHSLTPNTDLPAERMREYFDDRQEK